MAQNICTAIVLGRSRHVAQLLTAGRKAAIPRPVCTARPLHFCPRWMGPVAFDTFDGEGRSCRMVSCRGLVRVRDASECAIWNECFMSLHCLLDCVETGLSTQLANSHLSQLVGKAPSHSPVAPQVLCTSVPTGLAWYWFPTSQVTVRVDPAAWFPVAVLSEFGMPVNVQSGMSASCHYTVSWNA